MSKLTLKEEEARSIVWEDHPDWEALSSTETIEEQTRWSVHCGRVHKHIPSGKHYQFYWSAGATEMQDEKPYEYEGEVKVNEVEQRQVTVTRWVTKR